MPNVWKELSTDAPYDPWVLHQLFATVAGWDSDEAVAIEAVTINEADKHAARWRNHGGGGAGAWDAADGSGIASADDDGFHFAKEIGGTSASFSGAVSIGGALEVEGPGTFGDTLTVDGPGAFGDTLEVAGAGAFHDTLTVDGPGSFGDTLDVDGALAAHGTLSVDGSATLDGAVTLGNAASDPVTINGTSTFTAPSQFQGALSADGAVTLGNAAADVITVNGTTTFGAPITGATATFSGGISAGASSSFTGGVSVVSGGVSIIAGGLGVGAVTPSAGDIRLASGTTIYGRTATGTNARLLAWDSANDIIIGESGTVNGLRLHGTGVVHLSLGGVQKLRIDAGGMGFFANAGGGTTITPPTLAAASTDLPTVITLANSIRTALRNYGLAL